MTKMSPDLRGRPPCSFCIPAAAGGFGKALWPSASHGSWTATAWETITSSLVDFLLSKSLELSRAEGHTDTLLPPVVQIHRCVSGSPHQNNVGVKKQTQLLVAAAVIAPLHPQECHVDISTGFQISIIGSEKTGTSVNPLPSSV